MREIDFEEHKAIEYEILCKFSDYCENNQLRYFLAYGSLIGAVRHNGFIPWDDDIDVYMPRDDYNRLISTFNSSNVYEELELIDPLSDKSRHPYVKIIDNRTRKIESYIKYDSGYLGVDIDVFPLDGQPDNQFQFVIFYKVLKALYFLHLYTVFVRDGFTYKSWIILFIANVIFGGKRNLVRLSDWIHSLYSYDSREYSGSVNCLYSKMGDRAKKTCFTGYTLHTFEQQKFRIPIGYDEILKNLYGDYMKLPPENEQMPHHSSKVYWIDD